MRVAGVQVGDIGKVELEDGRAVVEMQIRPEYKGLVRKDATVLLRPKTGLKDMFLEVDPGDGAPVPEEGRIELANTAPDVDPDEILSVLDGDTRDYLKLLIGGAGKGLAGRGEDLRQTFKRLEPLHRDLAAVNTSVARRRTDLKRLINDYGSLMEELSNKDEDLTRLVRAGNDTFSALAAEEGNLSLAVRRLPGALRESQRTLDRVDILGQELGPTLESLRPAVRRLDETNAAVLPFVREAEPIVRKQIRPFTRIGQPYVRNLGDAARDLTTATPELTTSRGRAQPLREHRRLQPARPHPPLAGQQPARGLPLLAGLDGPERRVAAQHRRRPGRAPPPDPLRPGRARRRSPSSGRAWPTLVGENARDRAGPARPRSSTTLLAAEFGTCSFQGVDE